MTIEERMDLLEFQNELLYQMHKNRNNPAPDYNELLFEFGVTRYQAEGILDVVDDYNGKIRQDELVKRVDYEDAIYQVVPKTPENGQFAEFIARYLEANGRYEAVYQHIYNTSPL